MAATALPEKLLLHLVKHAVTSHTLDNRRIWCAPFRNRCKELSVLQFDAVHRNVYAGHGNRIFVTIDKIVIPRYVGAVVTDLAEERAKRSIVVERQR